VKRSFLFADVGKLHNQVKGHKLNLWAALRGGPYKKFVVKEIE